MGKATGDSTKPKPNSMQSGNAKAVQARRGTHVTKENKDPQQTESKIPRVKPVGKSGVKPVPDFSKLHQKWEAKLSSTKSQSRREPIARRDVPSQSTATRQPAKPAKPSVPPTRPATIQVTTAASAEPTGTVSVTGMKKLGLQGPVRAPVNKPVVRKRPVKDDEFNNEALKDILNSTTSKELDIRDTRRATSVFGLGNAKRMTLAPPRRVTVAPKKLPQSDAFDNSNLADILESTDADELDMRAEKRKTGFFGLGNPKRLTLNPPRRVTVAPKRVPEPEAFDNSNLDDILASTDASDLDMREARRQTGAFGLGNPKRMTLGPNAARRATVMTRGPPDELAKRASIYAGPLRVMKRKPAQNHVYFEQNLPEKAEAPPIRFIPNVDGPTTSLERGMEEFFARRNAPKTPGAIRFPTAQTPYEKKQNVARRMGMLLAETYGTTPQRVQDNPFVDTGRTPRNVGVSFRDKLEAENLGGMKKDVPKGVSFRATDECVDKARTPTDTATAKHEASADQGDNSSPVHVASTQASTAPSNFLNVCLDQGRSQEEVVTTEYSGKNECEMHGSAESTQIPIPSVPAVKPVETLPPISTFAPPRIPSIDSMIAPNCSQPATIVPSLLQSIGRSEFRPSVPNPFDMLKGEQRDPSADPTQPRVIVTDPDSAVIASVSSLHADMPDQHLVHPPEMESVVDGAYTDEASPQPIKNNMRDDAWRDIVGITSAAPAQDLFSALPAQTESEMYQPTTTITTTSDAQSLQTYNPPKAAHPNTSASEGRRRRRSSVRSAQIEEMLARVGTLREQEEELKRMLEEGYFDEEEEWESGDDEEWENVEDGEEDVGREGQ